MKIIFICKKHYIKLMREFQKTNPPEVVHGVLDNTSINWFLRDLAGMNCQIRITPYLKKIKIVNVEDFKLRRPNLKEGWFNY